MYVNTNVWSLHILLVCVSVILHSVLSAKNTRMQCYNYLYACFYRLSTSRQGDGGEGGGDERNRRGNVHVPHLIPQYHGDLLSTSSGGLGPAGKTDKSARQWPTIGPLQWAESNEVSSQPQTHTTATVEPSQNYNGWCIRECPLFEVPLYSLIRTTLIGTPSTPPPPPLSPAGW